MAAGGHSSRESSCGSNRCRDLTRCGDVRRWQRAGRWMYPKWAGSLYLAAAAHNGWDTLGVGTESWGAEYLIFDFKQTALSSKPSPYR
jgi:hypothetical protein